MKHETCPSRLNCPRTRNKGPLLIVFFCLFTMHSQATTFAGLPSITCLIGFAATGQDEIDAAHVMGNTACRECHQSEVKAWEQSNHAKKSFSMLEANPKAKEFGTKLGISSVASSSAVCTTCHGLRQSTGAQQTVLSGNSCEACHGGAGPREGGWFAVHSDFGGKDVQRDAETQDHLEQRISQCAELGMNRSANVYELAKNCYQCHTVPNEEVVNKGGHPTGNPQFEFLAWAQGEVRHNFQLDQKKNADAPTLWTNALFSSDRTTEGRHQLMYVVGQLVDLEVSLRNRAKASSKGNYAAAAGKRVSAAQKNLKKINKAVKLAEVSDALAAVDGVKRSKLRKVSAGDAEFFGRVADKVAAAAKQLADSNNGNELGGIKKLLPKKAKGKVFQP